MIDILIFVATNSEQQRQFVGDYYIQFDPRKDGNCQFSAVCDQLQKFQINKTPDVLRNDVVQYIRSHPYLFHGSTHLRDFMTTDFNT